MNSAETRTLKYAVDIVFCIDVTGSMAPVIDSVKESALTFHSTLQAAMEEKGKSIGQLRVKVIAFRDFGADPSDAIDESAFWKMPEGATDFDAFIRKQRSSGGGDEPESGLEALALAVASPWEHAFDRRRHIITLFTDASAHGLGFGSTASTYPRHIPKDMNELFERWGYGSTSDSWMENGAKRLLLFAPDVDPWNVIASDWNNTIFFPSQAGSGLEDLELEEIVNAIANSI